jgi:hypothetical protein
MLLLVVILLVAYIVVPLIDLVLNERIRIFTKIAVYALTLAWVIYTLFVGKTL